MRLLLIFFFFLFANFAPAGEVRTWTNQAGDTIEAEFISQSGNTVTILRTADNRRFRFPLATLSPADQEWLAAQKQPENAGVYIAVGNGLHRMSSNDGLVWSNHVFEKDPGHDQTDLKHIAAGNGAVVVVGGFSKSNILTTRDGVDWLINDFNIGALSGVIFVDGQFYAFGEGARVARSPGGEEWEEVGERDAFRDFLRAEKEAGGLEKTIKSNLRAWRYANGTYVGAGDNSIVATTTDFKDWEFQRLEPRERLRPETDGQAFVLWGGQSLFYSPDGEEWVDVSVDTNDKRISSVEHDGERFLMNTRSGEAWESPDGKAWSKLDGVEFPGFIAALRPDLYYSFKNYWQYTEDLKVSTDGGKTWQSTEIPAPAGVTNILFTEELPALP